jgi:hypothetical protein
MGASSAASFSMRSNALGLGAELLVKDDVVEFRQPVFQPRLEIGLVEELGIGQPRADDALVAGDDLLAAVLGLDIGDQDELAGEPRGLGIAQHEAFLVVADGGADDLGRDGEKRLVERTHQHDRPLDQPGHLGQQARHPPPVRSPGRRRGSWRRRG